jgi:hypothetical protein
MERRTRVRGSDLEAKPRHGRGADDLPVRGGQVLDWTETFVQKEKSSLLKVSKLRIPQWRTMLH